jgi:hypothetical protein
MKPCEIAIVGDLFEIVPEMIALTHVADHPPSTATDSPVT